MQFLKSIIISLMILWPSCVWPQQAAQDFDLKLQQLLEKHYNQFKRQEYFSGASLSIALPKQAIKNFYVGRVSQEEKSDSVSHTTLFQIGSITKSFTAAIILQLEGEGILSLTNTLQNWLPQYSKWTSITIKELLNMTSGLPNYSDSPLWNAEFYFHPQHIWTSAELINFVYPDKNFSPPLKAGYFYTNTGYILSSLIIEKASKNSFAKEIVNRTFKPASLHNTFYIDKTLPDAIQTRLAHGYNYNQYDNPSLVGKDITDFNISWAAAAGGVISNSEDIIKWVRALFVDDKILNMEQKNKLMQLVSTNTGKPIQETDKNNPRGFALGVAQAFDEDKEVGRFWYYEGITLGFRALYLYQPCNGVIISAIFNSANNSENDHAGVLMKEAYKLILKQYPHLACKKNNNTMKL